MNKKGLVFSLGAFLILFVCIVFAFALQRFDAVSSQQLSDQQVRDALLYARNDIAQDVIALSGAELRMFSNATEIGINLSGSIPMYQGVDFPGRINNYVSYYTSYVNNGVDLDWVDPEFVLQFSGNNGSLNFTQDRIYGPLNQLGTLQHLIIRADITGFVGFSDFSDAGSGNPLVEFHITNDTTTDTYSAHLDGTVANGITVNGLDTIIYGNSGEDHVLHVYGSDHMNITEIYVAYSHHENESYVAIDQGVNVSIGRESVYGPLHVLDTNR